MHREWKPNSLLQAGNDDLVDDQCAASPAGTFLNTPENRLYRRVITTDPVVLPGWLEAERPKGWIFITRDGVIYRRSGLGKWYVPGKSHSRIFGDNAVQRYQHVRSIFAMITAQVQRNGWTIPSEELFYFEANVRRATVAHNGIPDWGEADAVSVATGPPVKEDSLVVDDFPMPTEPVPPFISAIPRPSVPKHPNSRKNKLPKKKNAMEDLFHGLDAVAAAVETLSAQQIENGDAHSPALHSAGPSSASTTASCFPDGGLCIPPDSPESAEKAKEVNELLCLSRLARSCRKFIDREIESRRQDLESGDLSDLDVDVVQEGLVSHEQWARVGQHVCNRYESGKLTAAGLRIHLT
eukprot:ANDGO_00953.mRNA.1 hypothetical protein